MLSYATASYGGCNVTHCPHRSIECHGQVRGKSQTNSLNRIWNLSRELDINHLSKSRIPIFIRIPQIFHSQIESQIFYKNKNGVNRFSIESQDSDIWRNVFAAIYCCDADLYTVAYLFTLVCC